MKYQQGWQQRQRTRPIWTITRSTDPNDGFICWEYTSAKAHQRLAEWRQVYPHAQIIREEVGLN